MPGPQTLHGSFGAVLLAAHQSTGPGSELIQPLPPPWGRLIPLQNTMSLLDDSVTETSPAAQGIAAE